MSLMPAPLPEAVPGWFGPAGRPSLGWVHRPPSAMADAAAAGTGVLICGPLGPEAMGVHRTLRVLAEGLARAGLPTMRFDYDGTGDAAGDELDPDRLEAWLRTVRDAMATGAVRLGVSRWILVGVRLGAALAARVAAGRDDVDALVGIAPVLSGRGFVRELRAFSMAAAPVAEPDPRGLHEVGGCAFDEAAWQALAAIDVGAYEGRLPPRVLVLEARRTAGLDAWSARLAEGGVRLEVQGLEGADAMMRDPHEVEVPYPMLATVVRWAVGVVAEGAAASASGGAASARGAAAEPIRAPMPVLPQDGPDAARIVGPGGVVHVERVLRLGRDRGLVGVLAEPAEGRAGVRRAGVVILNAGAAHRVGPSRVSVMLARRLAALGHPVLRLDLPGLGDSPARPGDPDGVVYAPDALESVAVAVDWMRAWPQADGCRLVGLCSGAYHAFKAAVAGLPVQGIVAINPLTFFWHGDAADGPEAEHRMIADAVRLKTAAAKPGAWRRVVRGEVAVADIASIVARRAAGSLAKAKRALARRIGRPIGDDLEAELSEVARRGVPMHFVFAADEPGPALLEFGGGATARRLVARGALTIQELPDTDHTFTRRAARERLLTVVAARLGAPCATCAADGAPCAPDGSCIAGAGAPREPALATGR
jgi:alpha-beta hydrolase superfamily lysophospholipase